MKYRYLGDSGLMVSELSLGSYLTFGDRLNERESTNLVHTAFDHGINFFDTANVYQDGIAEIFLGKACKNLDRTELVIGTH
ncbi:aldo/keto reductase [Bacillus salitolerans]|uniref:Aldo/keto reductase n=1 Tax=Bacillus salitolerans TaxID=1437434 RepID=A0ABW4LKQ8_9BACI